MFPSICLPPSARWAATSFLVIGTLGLLLPLLLAYHFGSIHSPSADDWAYDRSAFTFATTGRFNLYHWGTVDILGQIVLAAPIVWLFGPRVAALNTYTCVLGFFGLLALVVVARNCGLSRTGSLIVGALCALCPMWAALSTSFMAEVPSFGLAMLALAAASHGLATRRMRRGWVALGLILAFVSFSIREQMMSVELAIAIAAVLHDLCLNRRWKTWTVASSATILASMLLYAYRHTLPTGGAEFPLSFQPLQPLRIWLGSWPLIILGLFSLPLLLYLGPGRLVARAWAANRRIVLWSLLAFAVAPPIYHVYSTSGFYRVATVEPSGHVMQAHVVHRIWATPQIGDWYYDLSGSHIWPGLIPNPTLGVAPVPAWATDVLYALGLAGSFLLAIALALTVRELWARKSNLLRPGEGSAETRALLMLNTCAALYLLSVLLLNVVVPSQNWDEYYFFLLPAIYVDLLYLRPQVARPLGASVRAGRSRAIASCAVLCLGLLPAVASGAAYTTWFESYMGGVESFNASVVSAHAMQLAHPGPRSVLADWMLAGLHFGDRPNSQQPYVFRPGNAASICYGMTAYPSDAVPPRATLAKYHALAIRGRWTSWLYHYVLVALPFTNNRDCAFTFKHT